VEVEAGVLVEREELEALAAEGAAPVLAVEAARARVEVEELAVQAGEAGGLELAAGVARALGPVVVPAQEQVVEEDLAAELEVAGREVEDREEEVEDREEEVEDRAEVSAG
jgi:hypothetical protein